LVPGTRVPAVNTVRIRRWAVASFLLTIGNDGALDDRSKDLGALREAQGLKTTTNSVDQAKASGLEGEVRLDLVVVNIVGNVDQDLVGLWANSGLSVVGRHGSREDTARRIA
jgi:hypothetical protein